MRVHVRMRMRMHTHIHILTLTLTCWQASYMALAFETWADNFECFRNAQPLATLVDKASGY